MPEFKKKKIQEQREAIIALENKKQKREADECLAFFAALREVEK